MAKHNKVATNAAPTQAAPQGGDWDEAQANSAAPVEATATANTDGAQAQSPATSAPAKTTAEVVQGQIDAKTDEDVARQEPPELDPIAMALKELEKEIAEATDVGLAFDLLKQLDGIPTETRLEKRIKEACIVRVKKHCYDIQQGLPLVQMGANELAKEPGLKAAGIQEERLELAGRNDPDIKHLLDKIKALETKKD